MEPKAHLQKHEGMKGRQTGCHQKNRISKRARGKLFLGGGVDSEETPEGTSPGCPTVDQRPRWRTVTEAVSVLVTSVDLPIEGKPHEAKPPRTHTRTGSAGSSDRLESHVHQEKPQPVSLHTPKTERLLRSRCDVC